MVLESSLFDPKAWDHNLPVSTMLPCFRITYWTVGPTSSLLFPSPSSRKDVILAFFP